jgi:molybdenum cofactor cytidylyltransferase
LTAARNQGPIIRVIELRRKRVGFIQTRLPGDKDSVLEKATRVLAGRLSLLGAEITQELRCTHEEPAVRAAIEQLLAGGAELILIAGASAIVDRRDVIPAAIVSAGGYIEHYGMPVDPGNLLLLGYHCDTPVLGLPGCARSPKYNGLDKVLVRLAAGLRMNAQDIMRMGAGGLLKETASRGVPRAENTPSRPNRSGRRREHPCGPHPCGPHPRSPPWCWLAASRAAWARSTNCWPLSTVN